jgi:hypothetical protein
MNMGGGGLRNHARHGCHAETGCSAVQTLQMGKGAEVLKVGTAQIPPLPALRRLSASRRPGDGSGKRGALRRPRHPRRGPHENDRCQDGKRSREQNHVDDSLSYLRPHAFSHLFCRQYKKRPVPAKQNRRPEPAFQADQPHFRPAPVSFRSRLDSHNSSSISPKSRNAEAAINSANDIGRSH